MARRIAVVAVPIVLVVVGVAAFALWPRGTTEVSQADALADFRERGTSVPGAPGTTAGAGRPVPAPGVYVYAAEGEEVVKLGPLPAQTRPLGESVTAVVVDAGDGCFDWTLNLFVEHTEDTRYCVDGGALRIDTHVKHQQIGPVSPTGTMTCDPAELATDASSTADLRCTLTLEGGPAPITATLVGTAEQGAAEPRTVGDTELTATPVTVRFEVSGDLTGSWTEVVWWSDDHLPVRVERTLDLQGLATFSERSTLDLTSLQPSG